jgi:IS1 family transposase
MNCLSVSRRVQVVAALVEGNSVNSVSRMTGITKRAILHLLAEMGCACAEYHNNTVRSLKARRVQCDEIWTFVYAKQKNVTAEQMVKGAGDCWTWTGIDADSKLIISYMLGNRGASTANAFMQDLASRIATKIQLTTDGHRVYADAVENAFGGDIDYAMLVKIFGTSGDVTESRYSPATCIGCRTGVLSGEPDPNHISTSYVERPGAPPSLLLFFSPFSGCPILRCSCEGWDYTPFVAPRLIYFLSNDAASALKKLSGHGHGSHKGEHHPMTSKTQRRRRDMS